MLVAGTLEFGTLGWVQKRAQGGSDFEPRFRPPYLLSASAGVLAGLPKQAPFGSPDAGLWRRKMMEGSSKSARRGFRTGVQNQARFGTPFCWVALQ